MRQQDDIDDCDQSEFGLALLVLDSPKNSPSAKLDQLEFEDQINRVLETLSYREREIIKLRYGIEDGHTYTLAEIGRIFKVTRDRIRQVEANAIRKLQHPARLHQLEGFLQ